MAKARQAIELSKAVAARRQAAANARLAQVRARLAALRVPKSLERAFRAQVDKDLAVAAANIERTARTENEIIAATGDMVDFLTRTKRRWSFENGRFLFSTEADLQNFELYRADVERMQVALQGLKRDAEANHRRAVAEGLVPPRP
jgi:hypothetical protein